MSTIVEKLTAQGGGGSADFLNDIVARLWPNINTAASKMIKDIADPMFKTMLPGPLASLHFTKVELGLIPIVFSNVQVTKDSADGIELNLNVDWDGKCDIELDGEMIPKVGVHNVELHGRLSILLCPLTNIIPLIGAAQVAFINPPVLKLSFVGATEIADFSMINGAILKVILGIINSMAVLPNRYLVIVDTNNDYFKTYRYPLGIVRVTVEKAWGFAKESKTKTEKLFSKLTGASPDCYAKVDVGAEVSWKTTTKKNTNNPVWSETHDFVVTSFDQCITVEVLDQNLGSDEHIGLAVTTVQEILTAGGKQDLGMLHKGKEMDGNVSLACQFFRFAAEDGSFSAPDHKGDGRLCGLLVILVAGAFGIKGQREELKPSVVVTWGSKHRFQTVIKKDAPGTDISNPAFDQSFRVLVTADMVDSGAKSLRIACMNKETEVGGVDVPFADLLKAPNMMLEDKFDVGNGATVRASIILKGVKEATMQEMSLPQRGK